MSRREPRTRLHLIVTTETLGHRKDRRIKAKPRRPNPRTALLRILREQQQRIAAWPRFERVDAPELFDLAQAADCVPQGRKSFMFRGVRFRLKFGWRRYVCDPKTGSILVGGGWLA